MRRRTVLTAMAALLAGCADGSPWSTRSPTDALGTSSRSPTATRSPTRSATPTRTTERPTTTSDSAPTPSYDVEPIPGRSMTADEVRERLADRDCTPLAVLPVTCPGDDARLRVSVSPTVADFSGNPVEFTVENEGDEKFMTNHYDWDLQKWDGSGWRPIAPLAIPVPLHRILPGDSHTYEISRADGERASVGGIYAMESDVAIAGLGPGVYGFTARGYYESSPEAERAVAAPFGFAGEGWPIRPTDDVTGVERDRSTLIVRAEVPAGWESDEFAVSFVGGDPDVELLPEHVHQVAALRSTLPYAATDGVSTVRYVGTASGIGFAEDYLSFVTDGDPIRYGFRDLTFEVTAEV